MATARVVEQSGAQLVHLPKGFRVRGSEVEIHRRGDEIVLREKRQGLSEVFELLTSLPDDFMEQGRQQPSDQTREIL
ncbi:MAG: AbrB/MazE/SpoVT family DNA-binding domain-containing protein [Thermodesulfobacteriota bacterium]